MERETLIEGLYRSAPTGRHRRYYAITSKGTEELARRRTEWRNFSRAIDLVMTD
jgi:DNA-binding PadR family transcriptional regulator